MTAKNHPMRAPAVPPVTNAERAAIRNPPICGSCFFASMAELDGATPPPGRVRCHKGPPGAALVSIPAGYYFVPTYPEPPLTYWCGEHRPAE